MYICTKNIIYVRLKECLEKKFAKHKTSYIHAVSAAATTKTTTRRSSNTYYIQEQQQKVRANETALYTEIAITKKKSKAKSNYKITSTT